MQMSIDQTKWYDRIWAAFIFFTRGGALAADGLADGWRDGSCHLFRQSGAADDGDGVARHRRQTADYWGAARRRTG